MLVPLTAEHPQGKLNDYSDCRVTLRNRRWAGRIKHWILKLSISTKYILHNLPPMLICLIDLSSKHDNEFDICRRGSIFAFMLNPIIIHCLTHLCTHKQNEDRGAEQNSRMHTCKFVSTHAGVLLTRRLGMSMGSLRKQGCDKIR